MMTPDEAKAQGCKLLDFITNPFSTSVYSTHPNDLVSLTRASGSSNDENFGQLHGEWDEWWKWCGEHEDSWKQLVKSSDAITSPNGSMGSNSSDMQNCAFALNGLPRKLARLLFDSKCLSLPRQLADISVTEPNVLAISHSGMSPKKFHEVSRMTSYVLDVLDKLHTRHGIEVNHVIDIGAGQGHLSRSLCNARSLHVLALDSSPHQAENNLREFQESRPRGTLDFRTLWLGEAPSFGTHPGRQDVSSIDSQANFERTICDWLSVTPNTSDDQIGTDSVTIRSVPVLFVALHACGSLTPAILRKVLEHRLRPIRDCQRWFVAAAVVVGCCYNLMQKDDFPLSQALKNRVEQHCPGFCLSPSHLQLAAQVPSQWFKSPTATAAAELAMKKILYRALTTPFLNRSDADEPESDTGKTPQRLGKLNRKAYESFEIYLERVGKKLGMNFSNRFRESGMCDPRQLESTVVARLIKPLHALRCLLGPPVESLIILDRYLWLKEELHGDNVLDVLLVNLFDQDTGSGRNVGLVLTCLNSDC